MSKTLEASIDVEATPEQVWKVVSDLERMGEWSPQCKKMKVFGGDVRKGTTTLNINRKGMLVWPTTAKVVEFQPNKAIAFRIVENKTIWSYTLTPSTTGTGTTV
ncbi:MAG: SRPBCC family protein, partial [Rhodococcus sp. (in: high G+C Gram-positive bacteria)]